MSEDTDPPADDPFWDLDYLGLELLPIETCSKELTVGVSGAGGEIDFYRADIWGFQGYQRWPTASWLEVAHDRKTGRCRALWKSGFADMKEIPSAILSDWMTAESPDAALKQVYKVQKEGGRPIIGIHDIERVQLPDGRWRDRPIVIGYETMGLAP